MLHTFFPLNIFIPLLFASPALEPSNERFRVVLANPSRPASASVMSYDAPDDAEDVASGLIPEMPERDGVARKGV